MSEVKRYYVGINTKCLGGIGLVEMTDLYREATGFHGLVKGEDYDALKAENESLRKDADRYAQLKKEWQDDFLIGYLDSNVHPCDWDEVIDARMNRSPENH